MSDTLTPEQYEAARQWWADEVSTWPGDTPATRLKMTAALDALYYGGVAAFLEDKGL